MSSYSQRNGSSARSIPPPKPPCARSAKRASAPRCGRVPMMYYLTREARVDPQTPSQNVSASQAAFGRQQEEAKREQKDEDALASVARLWRAVSADAAADTAAVDAVLEAWRASKAIVDAKLAKPEEKKRLRRERNQRIKEAIAARCQCPSTCVLIMVPSYRRLCRGSSASSR